MVYYYFVFSAKFQQIEDLFMLFSPEELQVSVTVTDGVVFFCFSF